ncbi:MAG: hypothetical protein EOO38_29270 [Cytophagaceae bacterium]|nr:MAG: hypothetical protein EOO38_29270 [Cytophagaceae bacterium]
MTRWTKKTTLVIEIADFMELPADDRGMSFLISGNATLTVDASLVQRAITNLVSNAIRYGTPGSVIGLEIISDESTVRFSVSNYGEQIPAEHRARLFDRFYRTEFSRAREAGGSGLGLSIVKAIMKLHRGSVEVGSDVHGKTCFTLIFPIHLARQAVQV